MVTRVAAALLAFLPVAAGAGAAPTAAEAATCAAFFHATADADFGGRQDLERLRTVAEAFHDLALTLGAEPETLEHDISADRVAIRGALNAVVLYRDAFSLRLYQRLGTRCNTIGKDQPQIRVLLQPG